MLEVEKGQFLLSCKFKNCGDDFSWVFTTVYGPSIGPNKDCLWEGLGAIKGMWVKPWVIGGDFNIIRFPEERNREGRITMSMRRFSQIIDEQELKDIPLRGGDSLGHGA